MFRAAHHRRSPLAGFGVIHVCWVPQSSNWRQGPIRLRLAIPFAGHQSPLRKEGGSLLERFSGGSRSGFVCRSLFCYHMGCGECSA